MNFIRPRTIPTAARSPLKFLLAAFLAVSLAPAARTQDQQPDVHALASQVVAALDQSGIKSIVVFDFTGPSTYVTPVGGKLADDLNDVLAQSSAKFKVVDRSRAVRALASNRLAPEITADAEIAVWLARSIGADAALVGKLSRDGANIQLRVDCFEAKDGKFVQSFQASFPLSARWQSELTMNIDPGSEVPAARPPGAGRAAIFPRCVSCPTPEFPPGVHDQTGSVFITVEVVVGTDGKPRDIRVVKAPEGGFSLVAIQAVQKWKFKPAQGADGKSVEARASFELSFSSR